MIQVEGNLAPALADLHDSAPSSQISLVKSGKWAHYHLDNRPIRARGTAMSRQRKPYYVQQKVSIPATLLARFSRFHWDPVLNKVQYGAISEIVTGLLSDYVNRMENPSIVPSQQPDQEKVN